MSSIVHSSSHEKENEQQSVVLYSDSTRYRCHSRRINSGSIKNEECLFFFFLQPSDRNQEKMRKQRRTRKKNRQT